MKNNVSLNRILIIDFGSQYTQLIARRIRELGVYCEIYSYACSSQNIIDFAPAGIILSGGPATVTHATAPSAPSIIFDLNCPLLGICYGMQTMAAQLGGKVEAATHREFGLATVNRTQPSRLFSNIDENSLAVWMSHGDHVTQLPQGFKVIASSGNTPYAAIADEQRNFYALQFHPEVTHTQQGEKILRQFLYSICDLKPMWTTTSIIEQTIEKIRTQVGNERVILGLSGGVDSSVAALLLQQAIGDQLECVFIDNGLLRLHEVEQVEEIFKQQFKLKIHIVNAASPFLADLKGITDPEQKRKRIGQLFIEIFEEQAKKISGVKWLAQGTIYPDVIESAATPFNNTAVIKSHHNVGGLPERMSLKLIEPLRELFKDEVRRVGLALGLPSELLNRHPFPGPGLAVRIIGEVSKPAADLLRQVDAIFIHELKKHQLYDKVSQAFAVLLPVYSVAVMGDARIYERVVALRAVETVDFMTATWARLPYEFLAEISNRIVNEVRLISRVVYDISSKPPATIEWE